MNRLMKQLVKKPFALMEFNATGRIPSLAKRIDTPLITLLRKIPPMLRKEIRNIRLSPNIGYTNSHCWDNAEQLLTWAQSEQGYSWSVRGFNRPLTINSLLNHSNGTIKPELLEKCKTLIL